MSVSIVRKNNVMAGFFVIGSIALAVVISVILGEFDLGEKREYLVRFPTDVGVGGLQTGADVTFGGLSVGRVTGVTPVRTGDDPDATVTHIDARIAIDASIVLYEDAKGDLSPPLLGGLSSINFRTPGGSALNSLNPDPDGILNDGEIVEGRYAPSILTQLGFPPEYVDRIKEVVDNARTISNSAIESVDRVNEMTRKLNEQFGEGVDDGATILANLSSFSDNLGEGGRWSEGVDSIIADTDKVTAKLPGAIDEARGTIESVRTLVDVNAMRVRRILDNTERATERLNSETFDKVHAMIERGSVALANFDEGVLEVNELIRHNRPAIDDTISNIERTSLTARLAAEEFRAQPWRLLSQPDKEELEREPLYAAARSYASAVSELRDASRALDDAVETSAKNPGRPEEIRERFERLAGVVENAYERYEEAERALLERLAEP